MILGDRRAIPSQYTKLFLSKNRNWILFTAAFADGRGIDWRRDLVFVLLEKKEVNDTC